MPFEKCKVYSDGSHYIAIPHTTRPYRPRPQRKEEVIPVQASPPQEYEPRTDDQKSDATDNSGTQHPIKSEIIDLQEQTNTLTSPPVKASQNNKGADIFLRPCARILTPI